MNVPVSLFARPHLAPDGDPRAYLEIARMAERAGMHSILFGEHLVVGRDTSRYPYGPWIHHPDTAWYDPLITMAAVSAVTTRLRLSTGVVLAPLRPGLVLAKEVATLDVMSGGRVELGVGTGWQSEEYVGTGLAWRDRQRRFDEVIETCRTAWGDQPFAVSVDGQRVEDLTALPRPVQPRIPIYYGVKADEANAERIARLGDGWTPVGLGPDELRAGVARLAAAYERAGRDPASLVVRVSLPASHDRDGRVDPSRAFEHAEAYRQAGATSMMVSFAQRLSSLGEAEDIVFGAMAAARRAGLAP